MAPVRSAAEEFEPHPPHEDLQERPDGAASTGAGACLRPPPSSRPRCRRWDAVSAPAPSRRRSTAPVLAAAAVAAGLLTALAVAAPAGALGPRGQQAATPTPSATPSPTGTVAPAPTGSPAAETERGSVTGAAPASPVPRQPSFTG